LASISTSSSLSSSFSICYILALGNTVMIIGDGNPLGYSYKGRVDDLTLEHYLGPKSNY